MNSERTSTGYRRLMAMALFLAPFSCWATGLVVSSDTYVSPGANASLNFGTLTSISVGQGNRALIQMDLSALPAGLTASNIQKATITVYVNKVLVAGSLDFSLITSAWTETGVTFNVQPSVTSAFAINVPVATSNTYVTVDVTTQVQEWVQGVFPNNGIEISASAANPTTQAILDSKETTSSSHPAFLDVTVVSVGPSGPPGAVGPSGARGPSGPAGPAGPSTLGGLLYYQRYDYSLPGNSFTNFTLSCPASNPNVVSGGCGHRDYNSAQADITVNSTGPDADDPLHGWNCKMNNSSSSSRAVVWWVLCSK